MKTYVYCLLFVCLTAMSVGCSKDQARKFAQHFDPRFPGKAATHIVVLDKVQIGGQDFNLSSFGNPLNIQVTLRENGSVIQATTDALIRGTRGERYLDRPLQWVVNFDPRKNYQIVLEEQSIIAQAKRWSIPGTPKLGYWPVAEEDGIVKFGTESYLHFQDKVAQ